MDNKRLFLFAALAFVMLLIWQAWQADYGIQGSAGTVVKPAASNPSQTATPTKADVPNAGRQTAGDTASATVPDAIASIDKNALAHGQTV